MEYVEKYESCLTKSKEEVFDSLVEIACPLPCVAMSMKLVGIKIVCPALLKQ